MHVLDYMTEAAILCQRISHSDIERLAEGLAELRGKGRLYIIGLGGSMANAIHMAADLRKLCDIDAHSFSNISELTARANDNGMENIFCGWLRFAQREDALLILSVGGGTNEVSVSILKAIDMWHGGKIFGIVGPDGGRTASRADVCIKIPAPEGRTTPHTEAFQAVIWHALVSHPLLQRRPTTWV